jgi:hypothetical protein
MMSVDRRRYTRQIRLADVGEAGQARLEASPVVLGGTGFARWIEERYLRAAGVGRAAPDGAATAPPGVDPSVLGLRHEAAREVGDGALRALVALRRALGAGADPGADEGSEP